MPESKKLDSISIQKSAEITEIFNKLFNENNNAQIEHQAQFKRQLNDAKQKRTTDNNDSLSDEEILLRKENIQERKLLESFVRLQLEQLGYTAIDVANAHKIQIAKIVAEELLDRDYMKEELSNYANAVDGALMVTYFRFETIGGNIVPTSKTSSFFEVETTKVFLDYCLFVKEENPQQFWNIIYEHLGLIFSEETDILATESTKINKPSNKLYLVVILVIIIIIGYFIY